MDDLDEAVAVIGMAARLPGADDVERFWANLVAGRRSMAPVEPAPVDGPPAAPNLVPMASIVEGIELFDAEFFGCTDQEAATLDPQHRLFLECAYHAMEQAGYVADTFDGIVGVYGATNPSKYLLDHVYPRIGHLAFAETMSPIMANMPDALATMVAYELNLTGPAVTVQTACSSSLVAVHMACQDLLSFQCDMVLAGGSAVDPAAARGYLHVPGGPLSPDGYCRVFDADADGGISGNGAGVVVLRRLSDALADGDNVRAVIRGTAVRNDGRNKVGYSGYGSAGITQAALAAMAAAGVDASEIGYVEAHATGIPVVDAVELSGLTRAFRDSTDQVGHCAIGSVKPNIGHLVAAAGIVALIKTVLVAERGLIPPTLNYRSPHPMLELDRSPFRVNTELATWDSPRLASVSASGLGGTHAHVIVQQPPAAPVSASDQMWSLLPLSAETPTALDVIADRLRHHLAGVVAPKDCVLHDIAYTLQVGRRARRYRRFVVSRDTATAAARLAVSVPAVASADRVDLVFLFTGDDVAAQVAFATRLADIGVCPAIVAGQGPGEYSAACVAGVLGLDDALKLAAGPDSAEHYVKPDHSVGLTAPRIPYLSAAAGAYVSTVDAEHLTLVARRQLEPLPDLPSEMSVVPIAEMDEQMFLTLLGELWVQGVPVDFTRLRPGGRRVPLPVYPFERRRHWIERAATNSPPPPVADYLGETCKDQ